MLTKKQYALLVFIHKHLEKTGLSPSFDEMRDGLGLKSKSGVHRLILALEERGFLRRLANRARALEVLKMPENLEEEKLPIRSSKIDILEAQVAKSGASLGAAANRNDRLEVPLYGRIAAGRPIEALRNDNNMVEVPQFMVGKGRYYALEVEGDSMMEAGILDGDTVIIEDTSEVRDNDIVVAYLHEDNEATLKGFERRGDKIILHPANRHYKKRKVMAEHVTVQGKLAALLRRY